MSTIKIRAKASGGTTTVKCLISHKMEVGNRKDKKTGKTIEPHYITEVNATHNGTPVMTANWSGGVSKNPYLSFKISGGASGDTIAVAWKDNQGKSDSREAKIK